MATNPKDVVDRFHQIWMTATLDELREVMSDDVEWHVPFTSPSPRVAGEPVRGIAAIVGGMRAGSGLWYQGGITMLAESVHIVDGDLYAMQYSFATQSHNGRPYRMHYVNIYDVRDGKIVRMDEILDSTYWMGQLMPGVFLKIWEPEFAAG